MFVFNKTRPSVWITFLTLLFRRWSLISSYRSTETLYVSKEFIYKTLRGRFNPRSWSRRSLGWDHPLLPLNQYPQMSQGMKKNGPSARLRMNRLVTGSPRGVSFEQMLPSVGRPRVDGTQDKSRRTGSETVILVLKHLGVEWGYKTSFKPDSIGDQALYLPCLSYVVALSFVQFYENESLGPVPTTLRNSPVRR